MRRDDCIKIFRKIVILSLPVIAVIVANLAVELHFKTFCLIKLLTGHQCWGCGLTRAFAALSRFEFRQAWDYNHLIVIVVPLLMWVWVGFVKKEFSK